MTGGVVLDVGGLIAVDRDLRSILVLLTRAAETGATITIPAPALAQAIRSPQRQVRLARLIRQPTSEVVAFGRAEAFDVGQLLASSRTSDVVDAHVTVCARRTGHTLVTSDPDDFRRLDDTVPLLAI